MTKIHHRHIVLQILVILTVLVSVSLMLLGALGSDGLMAIGFVVLIAAMIGQVATLASDG